MKKFKFLTIDSFLRKIKTKAFLISQIITTILIIGISIIPALIPGETEHELVNYKVALIDETDGIADIETYLKDEFVLLGTLDVSTIDITIIDDFWDNDNYDILIHYKSSSLETVPLLNIKDVDYYSKIESQTNDYLKQIVSNTKSMIIDFEDYELTLTERLEDIEVPPTDIEEDKPKLTAAVMSISTFYFGVVFFFIILSTQSLGSEILEEKSTKAIETIISSVPAEQHFYSKILSSVMFTTVQLGLMGLAGLIGVSISKLILKFKGTTSQLTPSLELSTIDNLIPIIIITVITAILGLLLYLIIFAFLASFANNNEEYQKAQTPLMIILLIVFYGSIILAGAELFGIIKWLSFFPFFTPFLLPISMLAGELLIWQGLLIIILLIGTIALLTWLILPAYRVSILNYSNDKLFKSIRKSFKASKNNKNKN